MLYDIENSLSKKYIKRLLEDLKKTYGIAQDQLSYQLDPKYPESGVYWIYFDSSRLQYWDADQLNRLIGMMIGYCQAYRRFNGPEKDNFQVQKV